MAAKTIGNLRFCNRLGGCQTLSREAIVVDAGNPDVRWVRHQKGKVIVASPKRTLEAVKRGQGVVVFADLQSLLEKLGFRLKRVSGSHHIYLHPKVTRPINIQPMGKDAKPYQVRQLRNMVEEFGLKLED